METNGTRAEKPTDDCTENPDVDPPAPEIDAVVTRGGSVGEPRRLAITVTHWPRDGVTEPVETTVTFRRTGLTATLADIEGDQRLADHLGAVAVAERCVAHHPAIEGVAGLREVYRSERQHLERCQERETA